MTDTPELMMDRMMIVETINHLFIGTDNRDWALVRNCFAANVWFDMSSAGGGDPKSMTPAEITAAWDAGLRSLAAVHHQAGNFLVRVSDDKARAFCYGMASHYLPNRTGRNTRTFVGSYDFDLVKNDGQWVICSFKFNLKYIDGNPHLETS